MSCAFLNSTCLNCLLQVVLHFDGVKSTTKATDTLAYILDYELFRADQFWLYKTFNAKQRSKKYIVLVTMEALKLQREKL